MLTVLRVLVPELDKLDALMDYGNQRMRQLCAERGVDWEGLNKDERQQLVDELLQKTWQWLSESSLTATDDGW